jgi:hypothetical protein
MEMVLFTKPLLVWIIMVPTTRVVQVLPVNQLACAQQVLASMTLS